MKQEKILIRRAARSDADFIHACQMALALETEDLALDAQTLSNGIAAVFSNSNLGEYWIAERSKTPVGMCLTIPEWSDWRNGTVLWIHSVYTLPAARSQGVYRELYSNLKKMVEDHSKMTGIRLYVDRRNQKAKRVYEGLGMTSDHYELYEWLKVPIQHKND